MRYRKFRIAETNCARMPLAPRVRSSSANIPSQGICQARRKRGGLGGLQPPNSLLKFVDVVSEKGCKSQGRRNEDSNSYIFEEATRIYQKWNIF